MHGAPDPALGTGDPAVGFAGRAVMTIDADEVPRDPTPH